MDLAAVPFRRKLLYSLLPVLFLCGFVEIVLLLKGHSLVRSKWDEYVFLQPHQRAVWREGRFFWERKIETSLNNLGLRGPDVMPSPADSPRLLLVGDSITFGEGVRDEEAFPSLVQRMVRHRIPRSNLEVVNGGIPGFGIEQEAALAESLLPVVGPDVVLLTFCVNDVFDILQEQSPDRYARYEKERFSPFFFLSATTRHLFMRYFIYLYVNGHSSSRINGIYPLDRDTPDVQKAWDTYFASVQSLADFLKERDVGLGLIDFPDFSQVVTGIESPEREFLAFGQEQGIPVLLLLEAFRVHRDRGSPILIPDGHPNAHAHAIIAAAVADWLLGRSAPPPFPELLEPGNP